MGVEGWKMGRRIGGEVSGGRAKLRSIRKAGPCLPPIFSPRLCPMPTPGDPLILSFHFGGPAIPMHSSLWLPNQGLE